MSQFFVNRPIVAMVIAIITVIVGLVSMAGLPVAQYRALSAPDQVLAAYVGADALTVEESVATPSNSRSTAWTTWNTCIPSTPTTAR